MYSISDSSLHNPKTFNLIGKCLWKKVEIAHALGIEEYKAQVVGYLKGKNNTM